MKIFDLNTPENTAVKHMGFAHCVLLVLAIDLGGLASSLWQNFLLTGIYEAIIIFAFMSMGHFMVILCLSELVGIVPFSGGNFGFVRCALGPFWGYIAASMEFLYYCMYNARSLIKISMLVGAVGEFRPDWLPLWSFLGMVFILLINIRGGLSFWSFMMVATLITIAALILFFVGTFDDLNFKDYALGHHYSEEYHNNGFIGDGKFFISNIYCITAFFVGLDILPLCSLRVVDESKVIPRALLVSFGIVFVIAFLAMFSVACHYPGIHPDLVKTKFVLQYGLADAVKMDPKWYPLLLLPPTVASATGYLFAAGNQLAAMAESGLMPRMLQPRVGEDQIPVVSMVVCAVMQFVAYMLIHHFQPTIFIFPSNVWFLAAPGLFVLICLAFIAFRLKFPSMKRNFVSPLGIPGAVYGVICWMVMAVVNSNTQFQPNGKAIILFYVFMAIMIIYYFVYARHVQCFSKEEQEKFMKAYIVNANQLRRKPTSSKPWPKFAFCWRYLSFLRILIPTSNFYSFYSSYNNSNNNSFSSSSMSNNKGNQINANNSGSGGIENSNKAYDVTGSVSCREKSVSTTVNTISTNATASAQSISIALATVAATLNIESPEPVELFHYSGSTSVNECHSDNNPYSILTTDCEHEQRQYEQSDFELI